LAEGLNRLATVFQQIGKFQEKEELVRRQLDLCQKLVKDFPNRPSSRFYLGLAYANMGSALRKATRLQEAEENFRQSVAIRAKLVDDFPGVPVYRAHLGLVQLILASVLEEMGRLPEAEQVTLEAWALLRSLARDYPAQVLHDWERRLRYCGGSVAAHLRLLRAFARVQLKELAPAVAEANAVAETGDADPTTLYHAACLFALAAAATGDAEQAEEHASRAIELLRQAFAKGYTNVEQMKKDSDLDPLRPRDDFRKFLAEFGNPGATP
jgi:tetratricopeptide (TPR) repeat protein